MLSTLLAARDGGGSLMVIDNIFQNESLLFMFWICFCCSDLISREVTKNYLDYSDLYYFIFLACVSVLVWSNSPEVIILPGVKLHSLSF